MDLLFNAHKMFPKIYPNREEENKNDNGQIPHGFVPYAAIPRKKNPYQEISSDAILPLTDDEEKKPSKVETSRTKQKVVQKDSLRVPSPLKIPVHKTMSGDSFGSPEYSEDMPFMKKENEGTIAIRLQKTDKVLPLKEKKDPRREYEELKREAMKEIEQYGCIRMDPKVDVKVQPNSIIWNQQVKPNGASWTQNATRNGTVWKEMSDPIVVIEKPVKELNAKTWKEGKEDYKVAKREERKRAKSEEEEKQRRHRERKKEKREFERRKEGKVNLIEKKKEVREIETQTEYLVGDAQPTSLEYKMDSGRIYTKAMRRQEYRQDWKNSRTMSKSQDEPPLPPPAQKTSSSKSQEDLAEILRAKRARLVKLGSTVGEQVAFLNEQRKKQPSCLRLILVGICLNIAGAVMMYIRAQMDKDMVRTEIEKKLIELGVNITLTVENEEGEGRFGGGAEPSSIILVLITMAGRIANVVGTIKLFKGLELFISQRKKKKLQQTAERLQNGEADADFTEMFAECCNVF